MGKMDRTRRLLEEFAGLFGEEPRGQYGQGTPDRFHTDDGISCKFPYPQTDPERIQLEIWCEPERARSILKGLANGE